MNLTVDDPESVLRRAVSTGATEVAPARDDHDRRGGRLIDPFGHHWLVGEVLPDPSR